ncbi:N-lysine methyltransferase protein [Nymphaea thermarum]|nr:N-lysine methyltransferase protein [Nymphaea thermarum]
MSDPIQEVEIAGRKLAIHGGQDVCDPVTGAALTGSWLWGSALVLADWMGRLDPSTFQGKTVVELGAGTGLPGLVAGLLGAIRVTLTDVGALLPGLRRNAEANGLDECVEVKELVWGATSPDEVGPADLVLMSDLFYDPDSMPSLAWTLRGLCRKGTILLAATETRASASDCFNVLMGEGFGMFLEHECQEYAIFTMCFH